ncbi:hypothetical protein G6F57_019561 [Rhizopus arrhizus]|nr:hypothetical protein G6F57_019561 [Rhizopus arrhizus]
MFAAGQRQAQRRQARQQHVDQDRVLAADLVVEIRGREIARNLRQVDQDGVREALGDGEAAFDQQAGNPHQEGVVAEQHGDPEHPDQHGRAQIRLRKQRGQLRHRALGLGSSGSGLAGGDGRGQRTAQLLLHFGFDRRTDAVGFGGLPAGTRRAPTQ